MRATHLSVAIGLAVILAACSREQPEGVPRAPDDTTAAPPEKSAEPAAAAAQAVAQIAPTQGNTANGALALAPSPQGVRITGSIQGLKPDAEFGFHVHEKGDCTAPDGSSAGAHFNPTQAEHGNPTGPAHHAGDLPNIKSNAEGVAQVDTTAAGMSLQGDPGTDLMGKAIVVHESPDDYTTQPSGNSGKRIACGVIATPSPQ
jgi:Cu-Zn family superoxide dismutase